MSAKLDERLRAVAKRIRSNTHADIGSDHGSLLVELLQTESIEHGIAVENKQRPFENSVQALTGMHADVRLGDGLAVLAKGEADSLSICGLGAESMRDILLAHPDRIPDTVVLQVFHKPEIIRRWALDAGFHLHDESSTNGRRSYTILSFTRASSALQDDPAYADVDPDSALLFGPLVLKEALKYGDPQLDLRLQSEEAWWRKFDSLSAERADRLKLVRKVMAELRISSLPQRRIP